MRSILVITSILALAADVSAAGPEWQYQLETMIKPGRKAAIVLKPKNDVFGIKVELQAGESRRTFKVKSIKAGHSKRLAWAVPKGVSEWSGTLTGSADGATTTAPLAFKVVKVGPLNVRISKEGVDLVAGRIMVRPTRPLDRVEVTAFDTTGRRVLEATVGVIVEEEYSIIAFDVLEDVQLSRVELKLHDPYGYWVGLRIVSWFAEIAHDDVEFESARWDVLPAETAKLDQTIVKIQSEIKRFRKELGNDAATVQARLYVAGYTDTVGSAADNRVLSGKRARAIAQYVRKKGLSLPIYYQGFGEVVQAVKTPDETDEVQNRRAVYVLANVPPGGEAYPKRAWKRLK